MDETHPAGTDRDWTVTITVGEHDGGTRATARLRSAGRESIGLGLSRMRPAEHGNATSGDAVAVARALADLAQRLLTGTDRDSLTMAP